MMIVACIQFKPVKGDIAQNLKELLKLCEQAAETGAKLIQLPEMCLSGYIWPSPESITPFTEIVAN